MPSSYKRSSEKSPSENESEAFIPNRRTYSYRDLEEVYHSTPTDDRGSRRGRTNSRRSGAGSKSEGVEHSRHSLVDIFGAKSSKVTETMPRHSLRITLAGALAGGLVGRQMSDGDTLTCLTAAALGAYSMREMHLRKK